MENANDNRRPMSELGRSLFEMLNDMNRMQYAARTYAEEKIREKEGTRDER